MNHDNHQDDDAFVVDTRRRYRGRQASPPQGQDPAQAQWDSSQQSGPETQQWAAGGTRVMPAVQPGERPQQPGQPQRQTPPPGAPGGPGGPGTPPRPQRARRPFRKRRILLPLLLLLIAYVAVEIWIPFNAWNNVKRAAYAPTGERPAPGKGKNYLLVGSDSREGLSAEQKKKWGATDTEGKRTDTIIVVHTPEGDGKPVMVSFPRDSWVEIPGKGKHKINAAYPLGGAKLLTETIEQSTGLHIDGYLEIGFGGFSNIVDAVGSVNLCPKFPMKDPEAGINLKPGCQEMDGANALGYVRSRKTDPLGDLGRAQRQREFLSAVMKKAATPGNMIFPWRFKSVADSVTSGITVGEDTSMGDAYGIMQAMRSVSSGNGLSITVPVGDPDYRTSTGESAVKWDTEKASALFKALKNDEPVSQ